MGGTLACRKNCLCTAVPLNLARYPKIEARLGKTRCRQPTSISSGGIRFLCLVKELFSSEQVTPAEWVHSHYVSCNSFRYPANSSKPALNGSSWLSGFRRIVTPAEWVHSHYVSCNSFRCPANSSKPAQPGGTVKSGATLDRCGLRTDSGLDRLRTESPKISLRERLRPYGQPNMFRAWRLTAKSAR